MAGYEQARVHISPGKGGARARHVTEFTSCRDVFCVSPLDLPAPVRLGALSRVRLDVGWAHRISALDAVRVCGLLSVLAVEEKELSLLGPLRRRARRLLQD